MNPDDGRDYVNVSKQIFGVNESRKIAEEMLEKVSGDVEVRGFSMGANDAFDLALDYNIDAILYDPPLNLRHILKNSLATGERTNTIGGSQSRKCYFVGNDVSKCFVVPTI